MLKHVLKEPRKRRHHTTVRPRPLTSPPTLENVYKLTKLCIPHTDIDLLVVTKIFPTVTITLMPRLLAVVAREPSNLSRKLITKV